MNYTTIALAAGAAAVLGLSSPASAQQWNPDRAQPFTPGWASPQLEVQPRGGPPGTRVRISGAGVDDDDVRVFYGEQRMRVLSRGDDALIAEIPRGVRGDRYIYVVGDTGRARTSSRYDLGPQRHRDYDDRRYQYRTEPWEQDELDDDRSYRYDRDRRYDRHDRFDRDDRYDRYDRDDQRYYQEDRYQRDLNELLFDDDRQRRYEGTDRRQQDESWLDELGVSDLF